MKSALNHTKSYITLFFRIAKDEYRAIFSDSGVLLILVFAMLIYSTIYSFAYAPQVAREIPIGVIDLSNSASSRRIKSQLDSGEKIRIAYDATDMEQAKQLLLTRKIYGIVLIPEEYEQQITEGSQAVISLYADASYLVVYRQITEQVMTTINYAGAEIAIDRLLATDIPEEMISSTIQSVANPTFNLYNPYLGYGTFVMPAVFMVIIQQTLLIGIGMIRGTRHERYHCTKLGAYDHHSPLLATITVLAKAMVYGSIYAITSLYILGIHYRMFHYPMNGSAGDILIFISLYITTSILFAMALSTLFRHRESAVLLVLWTSIPVLMLSGASLPREAIPEWLYTLGLLLPSSSGVEGFVRIETMGASLSDVAVEVRRLILLAILYFTLSIIGHIKRCDDESHPL